MSENMASRTSLSGMVDLRVSSMKPWQMNWPSRA